MPTQFAQAPEALLGRNDSKNVATTCKGITSSGRPCRRALAAAKSVPFHHQTVDGVWLYCWQHKDQAGLGVGGGEEEDNRATNDARTKHTTDLPPLQERTSLDTLVQRLGIHETSQEKNGHRRSRIEPGRQRPNREERQSHQVYAQDEAIDYNTLQVEQKIPKPRPRPKPRPSFWQSLCCVVDDDDYLEVVRHRKRTEHSNAAQVITSQPTAKPDTMHSTASLPLRPAPQSGRDDRRPSRPNTSRRYSSHTEQLLSLIPNNLSPQTTSSLLAELVKPISSADEDGYIYIFWLTPQSKQTPTTSTARSLLAPPASSDRPHHHRRISDVMTEYSFSGSAQETVGEEVVMLKIGRANNVTRRMHEWQRQCGYELNLVRWYPYISTSPPSPQPSPTRQGQAASPQQHHHRRQSDVVRKVPFVKRVERLVHLELAQKQVKRQCEACGREHREWFEVKASQAGVKDIDDCVRRWVEWAERKRDAELGEARQ